MTRGTFDPAAIVRPDAFPGAMRFAQFGANRVVQRAIAELFFARAGVPFVRAIGAPAGRDMRRERTRAASCMPSAAAKVDAEIKVFLHNDAICAGVAGMRGRDRPPPARPARPTRGAPPRREKSP